ncbi:hypothetical protein ACHAXS_000303, partial [Conticribra weissflogii]
MIFLVFLQLLVVTAADASDPKAIRRPFLHGEQSDVAKNKSHEIQTLLERNTSQNEVPEEEVSCDPIEEEHCVDYKGQAWCASVADGG